MAQYAVISDDLTGALDAGAGFAAAGLRAALPLGGDPTDVPEADVVLINTATREGSATEAYTATRDSALRLKEAGIDRVFKKMDSVLRGHPGPELAAVLDVFRGRALVAPAFPAQGRVTRAGVQYVRGETVAPYGGFLRDALESAAARADIRDAETDDDLARVAESAATNAAYRVWCGTAGLARHAPAALGLKGGASRPRLPRAERVCVLAGTGHPATNAQIDELRAAALADVEILVEGRAYWSRGEPPERVYAALEEAARSLRWGHDPGLVLTGGETALIVCRALGARAIEVVTEALPGIPLGVLWMGDRAVAVATKSGGFGGTDALVQTCRRLLERN